MRRTLPSLTAILPIVLAVTLHASHSAATQPMRATAPPPQPVQPAPSGSLSSGQVLETMEGAGYTYVRVRTGEGEKWLAGPQTSLRPGDTVSWPSGMEMKGFASKALGRTFDSIFFVDRLEVVRAPETAPGASTAPPGAAPHGSLSGKAGDDVEVSGIARAEGGVTIAEIYDRRAELAGSEVLVRGKVVKFLADVMQRNWIHVRDGSRATTGENDLTVTSGRQVAVGDVVVVRGRLARDRDFGFGYRYDVIVEEAAVTVE